MLDKGWSCGDDLSFLDGLIMDLHMWYSGAVV